MNWGAEPSMLVMEYFPQKETVSWRHRCTHKGWFLQIKWGTEKEFTAPSHNSRLSAPLPMSHGKAKNETGCGIKTGSGFLFKKEKC